MIICWYCLTYCYTMTFSSFTLAMDLLEIYETCPAVKSVFELKNLGLSSYLLLLFSSCSYFNIYHFCLCLFFQIFQGKGKNTEIQNFFFLGQLKIKQSLKGCCQKKLYFLKTWKIVQNSGFSWLEQRWVFPCVSPALSGSHASNTSLLHLV